MSKIKTVALESATEEQLRTFASDNLGITLKDTDKRPAILARIRGAWDKPEITVSDDDPTIPKAKAKAAPNTDHGSNEFVTVLIERQEEPGGEEPVFLSVNGRALWVPRGEPARIRKPYFEVLKHSVKTVYEQNGTDEIRSRNVPMYPFRVISESVAA